MPTVATSVPLAELRKEQRRLAVLLNKPGKTQHISKVKKYPIHEVPPFWAWCSHLDPDGNFRNPALDYLRQGLQNVGKSPRSQLSDASKKRLVLSARGERDATEDDDRGSGYGYVIDALVTSRRDESYYSSPPKPLRYTKQGKEAFPSGYSQHSFTKGGEVRKEQIKRKDIEDFGYGNLRKPISLEEDELDEELKELGLEQLRGGMTKKNNRGLIPFYVPDNTPAPPSTAAGASGVGLPSIHNGGRGGMLSMYPDRKNLLVPDNSFVELDSGRELRENYSDGYPKENADSRSQSQESQRRGDTNFPPIHQAQTVTATSTITGNSQEHETKRSGQEKHRNTKCQCSSPVLMKSRALDNVREGPCAECGLVGPHALGCSKKAEEKNGSRKPRCSKCGQESSATNLARDNSKLSVSGSRQNTMVSHRDKTFTRDTTFGGSSSYHRQRTDLSSPFVRIRSTTDLSEDSVIMDEIEDRLKQIDPTNYRLPKEKSELSVRWDTGNQKGMYHKDDPPTYINKLNKLDTMLEGGAFDFHTNLDVNNVDTTLRLVTTPEPEKHIPLNVTNIPKRKRKEKEIPQNGYKEAYEKALSVAAAGRLPQEAWMYFNRITPAYRFSYFDYFTRPAGDCPNCKQPANPNPSKAVKTVTKKAKVEVKSKKGKPSKTKFHEMKHIFGNIDINDYYPGCKNNKISED